MKIQTNSNFADQCHKKSYLTTFQNITLYLFIFKQLFLPCCVVVVVNLFQCRVVRYSNIYHWYIYIFFKCANVFGVGFFFIILSINLPFGLFHVWVASYIWKGTGDTNFLAITPLSLDLVIEKNFRNSRLKAENLQKFWEHQNNI